MNKKSALNIELQHAFDVRLDFHRRLNFGPVFGGINQGYTSVKSGTVSGPRLTGKVLDHSGADWPLIRTDGVVELSAHYMLEADDGTLIYIRNLGYVYSSTADRPGYFRCTPYFRAPQGPHDWLNRTVIIGAGERHTDPDHTLFRYYAVL
jgi:hypothetical protein